MPETPNSFDDPTIELLPNAKKYRAQLIGRDGYDSVVLEGEARRAVMEAIASLPPQAAAVPASELVRSAEEIILHVSEDPRNGKWLKDACKAWLTRCHTFVAAVPARQDKWRELTQDEVRFGEMPNVVRCVDCKSLGGFHWATCKDTSRYEVPARQDAEEVIRDLRAELAKYKEEPCPNSHNGHFFSSRGVCDYCGRYDTGYWEHLYRLSEQERAEVYEKLAAIEAQRDEAIQRAERAERVSTWISDKRMMKHYRDRAEAAEAKLAALDVPKPESEEIERTSMTGVEMIATERQRQITVEGWTPQHDDDHDNGEMAAAASTYVLFVCDQVDREFFPDRDFARRSQQRHDAGWPWDTDWWKPSTDPIRNLVKAGALIAAEIDRLSRLRSLPSEPKAEPGE